MNEKEQAAFVEAYGRSVASVNDAAVADFVRRLCLGEDMDPTGDYISIMDALGVWHDAIKWQLTANP